MNRGPFRHGLGESNPSIGGWCCRNATCRHIETGILILGERAVDFRLRGGNPEASFQRVGDPRVDRP